MTDEPNLSGWGETTVRSPGAFASVTDMHRVISELFCHDSVLAYQQRVTEAGMREAVADVRRIAARRLSGQGEAGKMAMAFIEEIMSMVDPDDKDWGGCFPSRMVCPLHGQPEKSDTNGYGRMLPVLTSCPGVPWCRAHEGVRVG